MEKKNMKKDGFHACTCAAGAPELPLKTIGSRVYEKTKGSDEEEQKGKRRRGRLDLEEWKDNDSGDHAWPVALMRPSCESGEASIGDEEEGWIWKSGREATR
uniref:DUF834 domain-containing protein n=1 Tax=Oryza meridionalis TaxID=40149 RepID=A0A0E0D4I3_9ORYZ